MCVRACVCVSEQTNGFGCAFASNASKGLMTESLGTRNRSVKVNAIPLLTLHAHTFCVLYSLLKLAVAHPWNLWCAKKKNNGEWNSHKRAWVAFLSMKFSTLIIMLSFFFFILFLCVWMLFHRRVKFNFNILWMWLSSLPAMKITNHFSVCSIVFIFIKSVRYVIWNCSLTTTTTKTSATTIKTIYHKK